MTAKQIAELHDLCLQINLFAEKHYRHTWRLNEPRFSNIFIEKRGSPL